MEVRDFLGKLNNVRSVGSDQWAADCPACADTNRHLYISFAKDGKLLLDCKHGCGFGDIMTSLGLQRKDAFPTRPRWEFIREHIYTDMNEVPLAKKILYRKPDGNKTAVWYRYDRGKWIKGLNKMKVPLYHLKNVVNADTVYIVEGEKDVETVERLGFAATTSPNGAGSKFRTDFLQYLKDKAVIILTDNDMVGLQYGKETAEKVRTRARSVRLVPADDIYADIKAKGDISDIVDELGNDRTKELLAAAVNKAKIITAPLPPAVADAEPSDLAERYFIQPGIRPEKFSFNDKGNSDLFSTVFRKICRYNVTAKEWYVFQDGYWQPDVGGMRVNALAKSLHTALITYCTQVTDETVQKAYLENVGRMARFNTRETIIKDSRDNNCFETRDLDDNTWKFNCKNGTLDLKTLSFQDHDPADLLSKMSNVVYDPDAVSEEWEKFIEVVMCGDKEKALYLQKALGYALTGSTAEECFFILYGATTRNGKGTLTGTISYMMGDGYAAASVPETFAQKVKDSRQASGDIARLCGVRFLNTSEPPKTMVLDAALIKTLTGRDKITARHLHQSEIEFEPQFKIFMNTNYLPAVNDETVFTSERIRVITFDRHFAPEEQDRGLKDRLRTQKNISGIFNWCLEGLRMYLKDGLKMPHSVSLATAAYQDSSDKHKSFMRECLVEDPFSKCKAKDVYDIYKRWCGENGFRYENKSKFFMVMRSKGRLIDHATVDGETAFNIFDGYRIADDYLDYTVKKDNYDEKPPF